MFCYFPMPSFVRAYPFEQAFFLQGGTKIWIEERQGTRDGMADGAGLTGRAAAVGVHPKIELGQHVGRLKGPERRGVERLNLQIVLHQPAIDFKFAAAGLKPDGGDCVLAATGGGIRLAHVQFLISNF